MECPEFFQLGEMMKYILIGFMGAGKTTIGSALAQKLHLPFYDMDQEIIRQTQCSVSAYFAKFGEPAFRKLELSVFESLLNKEGDMVISTGGGTVMSTEAQQLLAEYQVEVLWLNTDFETLYQRLAEDDVERPLFINNTKEDFKALFDQRLSTYESLANHQVDVTMQNQILQEVK